MAKSNTFVALFINMKKNIAVVMGGYSGESEVSLNSAKVVAQYLDKSKYNVYPVLISPEKWVAYADEDEQAINLNNFSFELKGKTILFDAVFNALHGPPGEDGPLAGYFQLLNLPQTASGQFESAITFNKAECNILLQSFGIKTPKAVFLQDDKSPNAEAIIKTTGLPCFVKPSRSGSSIGVSKVKTVQDLVAAIERAREIDSKILVEGMISGLEVGCGVSNHTGNPQALAVTHIVPKNEFFDYESKYSGLSEEVTPARISQEAYEKVLRTSEFVYRKLGLNGLVRVDYIIDESGEPCLIEVNTVPGFSKASILPKQAFYAGTTLSELFNATIEKALHSKV